MKTFTIVGILVAVVGLLFLLFPPLREIGGILAILGLAIAVWTERHVFRIGKETKEIKADIKLIKERLGIEPYVDGLPKADPPVFDPFAKGLKFMTAYKWDEAISEFQKAMKEAKTTQLVALYNLIAICYYTSGRLSLALENFEKSLDLAREFTDKQGEANALGNIGNVYYLKGDLDQALKY
jgi:tetratricopeptide (TPR) repeat protein